MNENAVWRTTASSVVSVNAKDIVEGGGTLSFCHHLSSRREWLILRAQQLWWS